MGIDAFELWCWWRLLRVPWTARRSNQSILKEISPECSLEGLMLKLNLQYLATWCEELTHWKRPWWWEWLKAGGEGDDDEDEMIRWHHWLNGHEVWVNSGSLWWTGRPGMLQSTGSQRIGHNWATELNWTERCCEEKWALCSAGGHINGTVAMEISMMASQKKLQIELQDPTIPLLHIYRKETKSVSGRMGICIPKFFAALFTPSKTWKQPVSINK